MPTTLQQPRQDTPRSHTREASARRTTSIADSESERPKSSARPISSRGGGGRLLFACRWRGAELRPRRRGSKSDAPASGRIRDKQGFHRRATGPLHLVMFCIKRGHIATSCTISPHSSHSHTLLHFPMKAHQRESLHFCDNPVCTDPIWQLSRDDGFGFAPLRSFPVGEFCDSATQRYE